MLESKKPDRQEIANEIFFCREKLYRMAFCILHNESLALDAVDETSFRAMKYYKSLKEPKYLITWLMRIIVNVSRDLLKKEKNKQQLVVALKTEDNAVYLDRNLDNIELIEILSLLSVELREVLSLKYIWQLKNSEIAVILSIPEGTVKSRVHRALKLLRIEIEVGSSERQ